MAVPLKTTTNYKCYFKSYEMNEEEGSSANTLSETWIIEKKESTFDLIRFEGLDYRSLISEGAIPNIGATYGGWNTNASSGNYAKWWKDSVCLGHDFISNEGGRITVRHNFSTRLKNDPAQNTATTVDLRYPTSAEYQSGYRQSETFMKGPWTIQPQFTGSGSTGHIGGTIAIAGSKTGLIEDIPQTTIQIRTIKDSKEASRGDVAKYFSNRLDYYNEPAFFGYTAGTLRYVGYNIIELEGSLYEIVHTVLYDALYFNDQIPQIAEDGLPATTEDGLSLNDVRWSRPYRASFDFKAFFFTGSTPGANFDGIGYTYAYKGYY